MYLSIAGKAFIRSLSSKYVKDIVMRLSYVKTRGNYTALLVAAIQLIDVCNTLGMQHCFDQYLLLF